MPDQESVLRATKLLRQFHDDIEDILRQLDGKKSVSREEKESLQAQFKDFKERLTAEAKRTPVSDVDRTFLFPAVSKASANLRIATNSHPINSHWFSALYEIQADISLYLHNLEESSSG